MLPYILCFAALAALLTSLYKDRKIERTTPSVIRALRIHHVAQGILVLFALWNAVDTERSLRDARAAQLDSEAAAAAAKHTAPLVENYLLTLRPSAPALKSYITHQLALAGQSPQLADKLDWNRIASPELRSQRDNGLKAFSDLQRIARVVLTEQLMFGNRYPSDLAKWASTTLELKEAQLPTILGNSADAVAYADLLGRGIGFSIGKFRDAQTRLER